MLTLAKSRRGIFLISTLFVTLVVTMYLAGAIALVPGGLFQSQSEGFRAQARQAAESGIDYALARLRANPQWRGDGSSPNSALTEVSQAGLTVVEDHGNVIGVIGQGSGATAQFRLRFNYQDGSPGAEALDDPSSADKLDFNLISYNNLSASIQNLVPQATGSGASVTTAPPPARLVPSHSVWLCVQGRAGPGLDLSATNVNPNVAPGSVATVVVQAEYQPTSGSAPVADAVAMSGSTFTAFLPASLGNVSVSSALSGQLPNMRSNGTIGVNGGSDYNLVAPVGADAFYVGGFSAHNSTTVQDIPGSTGNFYQIAAGTAKQVSATDPIMAAGTYVVWQDGSVHYYDLSLADYKTFIANPANQSNPGAAASLPASMTLVQTGSGSTLGYNLEVTGNVNVSTTGPTNDLSIIPRSGAAEQAGTGSVDPTQLATGITGVPDWQAGQSGQVTIQAPGTGLTYALDGAVAWAFANPTVATSLGITFTDTQGLHFTTASGGSFDTAGYGNWNINGASAATPTFVSQLLLAYQTAAPTGLLGANLQFVSQLESNLNLSAAPTGKIAGVSDSLTAANLSLTFEPNNAQGFAVISTPANITLGLGVGGAGGSIVSGGNVSITGMGVSLSANPNAQQGLSLYSQGNVTINTFQQTGMNGNAVVGTYQDLSIKGVVYAWGDINATLGSQAANQYGNFSLQGTMVAYGGNPSQPAQNYAGNGQGQVAVTAGAVNLKFDPAYLQDLMNQYPANFAVNRVYWAEQ